MNSYGRFERLRTIVALSCGLVVVGCGGAAADDVTCAGIKRALVSANLAMMRLERGAKPVTPVQAAMAVGQMTALENVASVACSQADVDRIAAVVGPRIAIWQSLLPLDDDAGPEADTGEDQPQAAAPQPGTTTADANPMPTPPQRPSNADKTQRSHGSFNAATCTRLYYTKDGHRRWRCQR